MPDRPEDPVVEVSSDDEPGYEVRADGALVGPVTIDQVRRGRDSGRIPDKAQIREVHPWMPVEGLLDGDDQTARSMAVEVRFGGRAFEPVMLELLRRVHGQGRVPDTAEARWVSAWTAVGSLPLPQRPSGNDRTAADEQPKAAARQGAERPAPRGRTPSGSGDLPTRKLELSPEERDAVVARLRFTGTPTRQVLPKDEPADAAADKPRPRAVPADRSTPVAEPSSSRDPKEASPGPGWASRLLALGAVVLAGTIVIVSGIVVGALARSRDLEQTQDTVGARRTPPSPPGAPDASGAPRPKAPSAAPLWCPCIQATLDEATSDAEGQAGRPCAGGTLRTFRSDDEVLAVLDGLPRSSTTVARMPTLTREVLPNLPPPAESYLAERVLIPFPPPKKQPGAADYLDGLRLWDAAARAAAGCATVGACRGASWQIDGQRLSLEMAVDAQAIRLRFVLLAQGAAPRGGEGQATPERSSWPWRDELPPSELPAHHRQLVDKLVEARWYPADAPAFLTAATRAGFRDDESTAAGLWLVAAWLRHADEWGALGRTMWSSCLESRARKLALADRATVESFLGADPDRAAALVKSSATARATGPPFGPTAGRDAAGEALLAAIGTAAQVDCSFSLEACRMAASGAPSRANRVLREAPAEQAAVARRLICHQRFGHLLADELRRLRAAMIQPADSSVPSGPEPARPR